MAEGNEEWLLARARAFDREALAAIYDAYHAPLYRYISRQVDDMDTARDLTADLFNRFLQALEKGSGPEENMQAWLYRVAHNLVVDYYRRRQHRGHLPLRDDLVDGAANTGRDAERNLAFARARVALETLTPAQRQVITLKFLAGLSNEEVAMIMEKPIGAVKSLQFRGLAALQRQLKPEEDLL
jgi:RNA polymerase sigma-70 factor (ECF subfamily)